MDLSPSSLDAADNAKATLALGFDSSQYRLIAVDGASACLRRITDDGPMADTFWTAIPPTDDRRLDAVVGVRVAVLIYGLCPPGRFPSVETRAGDLEIPSEHLRLGETTAAAAHRAALSAHAGGDVGTLLADELVAHHSGSERLMIYEFRARAGRATPGVPWHDLRRGSFAHLLARVIDRVIDRATDAPPSADDQAIRGTL